MTHRAACDSCRFSYLLKEMAPYTITRSYCWINALHCCYAKQMRYFTIRPSQHAYSTKTTKLTTYVGPIWIYEVISLFSRCACNCIVVMLQILSDEFDDMFCSLAKCMLSFSHSPWLGLCVVVFSYIARLPQLRGLTMDIEHTCELQQTSSAT